MRGSYVEQNNLVRAGIGVSCGQLCGISGIAEIEELRAFDHAASVDIETRNDSFRQHL